jgi:hypothetical protein
MDHHTFDRLSRLIGASGSRRTAWRALLGAALLGTTTRPTAAAPCGNAKHGCGAGNACCPGKCFRHVKTGDELCCSGSDKNTGSALITCGNRCCQDVGDDPCDCCLDPGTSSVIAAAADPCPEGITGSYRRR